MNLENTLFFSAVVLFLVYALIKNRVSKTTQEWTLSGRNLNQWQVSFVIIGTLVGGASTIGTTQIAYEYGLPSLIFTFSSALACLVLAYFFSKKLRQSESITVIELIGHHYGKKTKKYLSLFALTGIFLQTVAQMIAASSIIRANLNLNSSAAIAVTSLFIVMFIVFFGITGASFLGKYKIFMLYIIMIISLMIIQSHNLPFQGSTYKNYGAMRAAKDIISTLIGVLSTQTYLQAIFAAKDIKSAKNGALLSAILIPPIGIVFYLIGIYMKTTAPNIAYTADTLAIFLKTHLPAELSSIFLAFLFIISVGTASGLFLGTLTMLFEDNLKNLFKNKTNTIQYYRLIGIILIILSAIITLKVKNSILEWSFLSMGLRGASIFLPLVAIIFDWNKQNKITYYTLILSPICYIIAIFILYL
ncbi:MAG: hypothetical protein N3C60_03020 [Calditerrivibrio sp.]|nr:hypothetical protein [Calditerrivibrio sp.]